MIRTFFFLLIPAVIFLLGNMLTAQQINTNKDTVPITADHSKFPTLKQKFTTAPEVTKACLGCHTEAANQIMSTIHWTWICPKSQEGNVGKKWVINNFCVSVQSNEPRCTSCHAGYGWRDNSFDFTEERNVDCLVCHDTTGTYKKFPTGAGHPVYEEKTFNGKVYKVPDFNYIAQNVGQTQRTNCGACHFYGGGGDNVKHGDMSSALGSPNFALDVHMDEEGLNFTCTECHTTQAHQISGRCYSHPAYPPGEQFQLPLTDQKRIFCESCHSSEPHIQTKKLNHHTDKIACQTCHIPEIARAMPTKMWWDWSKAGKFQENGEMIVSYDENGFLTYHTKKGEFIWEKNAVPEYYWFNGVVTNTLFGDRVDDTKPVKINQLHGHYHDPNAKIWPFKVHRGIQPYDKARKTLVVPKLFGNKDSGAYWQEYDWQKAINAGMDYADAEYSGEFGWIETEMYWIISHSVAPIEKALSCQSCHQDQGRLENVRGFYLPGRDKHALVDTLGFLVVGFSLMGVTLHGIGRAIHTKNKKDETQ